MQLLDGSPFQKSKFKRFNITYWQSTKVLPYVIKSQPLHMKFMVTSLFIGLTTDSSNLLT